MLSSCDLEIRSVGWWQGVFLELKCTSQPSNEISCDIVREGGLVGIIHAFVQNPVLRRYLYLV